MFPRHFLTTFPRVSCIIWIPLHIPTYKFLSLLKNISKHSSGTNFTNILHNNFSHESDLYSFSQVTFSLCNFLGKKLGAKGTHNMLVKLIPIVNFISIGSIFFLPKKPKPNIIREKLHKALSNKKGSRKMLVKSTPGLNFINILCTAFTLADPESVKRYLWLNCIFLCFLGSTSIKIARKMLVKSTPSHIIRLGK